MKTYHNKKYKKRNYNCTNVVFCQSKNHPGEDWTECDELDLQRSKCVRLYKQAGVIYYGYL